GGDGRPRRRGVRGAAPSVRRVGDRRKGEPEEMSVSVHGPADERREATRQGIRALLGPGGAASALFAGYEARPGQMAMAERIAAAIDVDEKFLAEAGTGTAKTR